MVVTQMAALALAGPFLSAGFQAFEDPEDPVNPLLYLLVVILFTALILLIVRMGRRKVVQAIILFATFVVLMDVFMMASVWGIWLATHYEGYIWELGLGIGMLGASIMTYQLYRNPEWYVVDAAGVLVGAGVASILGISLGILPVLILLVALAIYDAVSVYKTKHMIALADAVTEQHLPVLMVFPKEEGYSFKEQKGIKADLDQGKEREAMFIGLGDIVIPGALVVSAFVFLTSRFEDAQGALLVAVGTMVGILCGFAALMRFVLRGNPQAGLPLLNGGAIAGYFVAYYLVFQDLAFGISLW
jgi:presenilin-like A22 family membrane protease